MQIPISARLADPTTAAARDMDSGQTVEMRPAGTRLVSRIFQERTATLKLYQNLSVVAFMLFLEVYRNIGI